MRRAVVSAFVVALLVGTAAAFGVTESVKLDRSPVSAPRFTSVFTPPQEEARLSFRLRRTDRLDLVVVDEDGQEVRILAQDKRWSRGRVRVDWDGRDDEGDIVPVGPYRLRVQLERARRTITIPKEVLVDAAPGSA